MRIPSAYSRSANKNCSGKQLFVKSMQDSSGLQFFKKTIFSDIGISNKDPKETEKISKKWGIFPTKKFTYNSQNWCDFSYQSNNISLMNLSILFTTNSVYFYSKFSFDLDNNFKIKIGWITAKWSGFHQNFKQIQNRNNALPWIGGIFPYNSNYSVNSSFQLKKSSKK